MVSSPDTDERPELELADEIGEFHDDPLGFVRFAYPWGEPGPLENYDGPDRWQQEFLEEVGRQVKERRFDGNTPVMPIKCAVASGHGLGKGVMTSWLVNWIMSTRPHAQGTVTASTFPQLQTKTWPTIQKWTALCITSSWFVCTSTRLYHRSSPATWFCTPQTCRQENSESFAGQHAATSTSFYIFDEASGVPDVIWDVAEGGLTDGEPMWFAFGNPTRNSGRFHRVMFGADRERWKTWSIDSRQCRFSNKQLIQQWLEDHGEDSDFFRVRVRGVAPRAGDAQFIGSDLVYAAQKREAIHASDDPLILGFDVARGGMDSCVGRFRRGFDARSIPPFRIPGEQSRDTMVVAAKLADVLSTEYNGRKVDHCFIDGTGIGGPLCDRMRQLGFKNITEVQFGAESPDSKHYANMRVWMWAKGREWLRHGAIDNSSQLEADLTGPGYGHDKKDRTVLESKESMKARGLASSDEADALCLTFAAPIKVKSHEQQKQRTYDNGWYAGSSEHGWMA